MHGDRYAVMAEGLPERIVGGVPIGGQALLAGQQWELNGLAVLSNHAIELVHSEFWVIDREEVDRHQPLRVDRRPLDSGGVDGSVGFDPLLRLEPSELCPTGTDV